MSELPDQHRSLIHLAALQRASMTGLLALQSGGERPSDAAYESFFAASRGFLEATVGHENLWPGSFQVQQTAQPLVQQLGIYADHLDAAGEHGRAQGCRREADALTVSYLDPVAAAQVARDRAINDAFAGRFHRAIAELERVSGVFTAAGERLAAGQAAVQLANVYEWLGDHERALATLRAVHDDLAPALAGGPPTNDDVLGAIQRQLGAILEGQTSREGEDSLVLQQVAYAIVQGEGRIHRYLGHWDDAERLLLQARPFAVSLGIGAGIDFHRAAVAVGRGELDAAERLLTSIVPDFERPMIRPRRPALRAVQSELLLARGDAAQALVLLDDGLADQPTYPDLELEWKLQWRRARALAGLGRPVESLGAFRSAATAVDTLRTAPLGYRLDTTFVTDKIPMFEAAVDLAVARDDAAAAVWFIELSKSRALTATISVPRSEGTARSTQERHFDELSTRIDALAFALYAGAQESSVLRERQALLAEREALLESIRVRDPRWRAVTQPAPVQVEALAARLGASGRAALVLQLRPAEVVAGILDGDGVAVGRHPLSARASGALVTFVANLRKVTPHPFVNDVSTELGLGLADLLPAAILERAVAAATLLVVPHGVLHLLPWAGLTVGNRRLFETSAVGQLPNLGCLPLLDADPTAEPGLAAIGDPDYSGLTEVPRLAEAAAELTDVEGIYAPGLAGPVLRGPAATQDAFWQLMEAPGAAGSVLHVACHGTLDGAEPLASGLLLSGSTVDAAELLIRRCSYPEVVLSACSVGWRPQSTHGIELAGDDALGLVAAFLEAGARSLLVSVPLAHAATSRAFTVGWHRHRHGGATPLAAYRETQLEAYDQDPATLFLWAGMTAFGCR